MSGVDPPTSVFTNRADEESSSAITNKEPAEPPERLLKERIDLNSDAQSSSSQTRGVFFSPASMSSEPILEAKPGCDIVALIFLLLALPQSVSCLVLASYILSGSFKSLAGKVIAGYLVKTRGEVSFSLEPDSRARYSYYRSELLGEFLQLFSVNSFILMVCHYSLPRAWFQYLIVLAKSIVASRLVGTYATGSTTYVSVVSSNVSHQSSVVTTTTTNHGQSHAQDAPKISNRSIPSNFANFITGFSFVVAANYINDRISNWNLYVLLGSISKVLPALVSSSFDFHNGAENDDAVPYISSFTPMELLLSNRGAYYEDMNLFSAKASWASRFVFRKFIKYCSLGDKSAQSFAFVSKEVLIVINFAYLVLCIHVISLTISPFFKKVVILKDYSKTLDHLSSLTPDIPYGGYRKGGMMSSLPRDPTTDSVIVINMEQNRASNQSSAKPYEIQLDHHVASAYPETSVHEFRDSVIIENFKTFCSNPPAAKFPVPGSRQSHSRTIVDRKRSNSAAIPSTTIMDKYFTISTQPIWTWIAAINVLVTRPNLFYAPASKSDCEETRTRSRYQFDLSIFAVEDSKLVFELMNPSCLETLNSNITLRVNGVPWSFVDIYLMKKTEADTKAYILVYGLFASCSFRLEFLENDHHITTHVVRTTSREQFGSEIPPNISVTSLLQNSILYTVYSLSDLKAGLKKNKREESKKVADLKRHLDTLNSKLDKYGGVQSNEGRISGKLKGLQNSVSQLENEIKDLDRQKREFGNLTDLPEVIRKDDEERLELEIAHLESIVLEYDNVTKDSKTGVQHLEGEKEAARTRLKKTEGKVRSRKDEIMRVSGEIKGLKKALFTKLQKKQKMIHDRLESVIPKIAEASDDLSLELDAY